MQQVNQLDLSAYADELEKQGEGKRALQLDTIVEEIRYPYRYDDRGMIVCGCEYCGRIVVA